MQEHASIYRQVIDAIGWGDETTLDQSLAEALIDPIERFEGDTIVEWRGVADLLSAVQQLGGKVVMA